MLLIEYVAISQYRIDKEMIGATQDAINCGFSERLFQAGDCGSSKRRIWVNRHDGIERIGGFWNGFVGWKRERSDGYANASLSLIGWGLTKISKIYGYGSFEANIKIDDPGRRNSDIGSQLPLFGIGLNSDLIFSRLGLPSRFYDLVSCLNESIVCNVGGYDGSARSDKAEKRNDPIMPTLMRPMVFLLGAVLFLFGILLMFRYDMIIIGGVMVMLGTTLGLPWVLYYIIQD
jgi:hypothetical protein